MPRRTFLISLTALCLVVAVVALAACGSSGGTATTKAPAATGTTETADDYKTKMTAWVNGPLSALDTSVFDIPDPANATTAQIDAVAAFVKQAENALDQLKTIKPSAGALETHTQFVKAYEDLLAATDKYVTAMRNKDAGALPAINQAMSDAQVQIQQLVATLAPMIGMGTPSS